MDLKRFYAEYQADCNNEINEIGSTVVHFVGFFLFCVHKLTPMTKLRF